MFLPPVFCLMGPYSACWLDFSNFSIFRRNRARKKKKNTEGPIWEDRKIPDGVSCHSFTSVSWQLTAAEGLLHSIWSRWILCYVWMPIYWAHVCSPASAVKLWFSSTHLQGWNSWLSKLLITLWFRTLPWDPRITTFSLYNTALL